MSERDDPLSVLVEMESLADKITQLKVELTASRVRQLRCRLNDLSDQIRDKSVELDPVLRPASIFDPTDPSTAGRIVAFTLVAQPRYKLNQIPEFYGSGVYAIYYTGEFEAYAPLVGTEHPIYVGKADPERNAAKEAISQGTKLSRRLYEHVKSIRGAGNLDVSDFECRFLVVQTGFQTAAEDYLIKLFRPIWNRETKICYGIGKHGDSSVTRGNKRAPWDTMHPGRRWAAATTEDQRPIKEIIDKINQHFQEIPPFVDQAALLAHFLADVRQLDQERFYTPLAGTIDLQAVQE